MAAYRASREDAYRKLVSGVRFRGRRRVHCPRPQRSRSPLSLSAQHTGDAGASAKQLEEEGTKSIAEQAASIAAKREAVVSVLVGVVTKC